MSTEQESEELEMGGECQLMMQNKEEERQRIQAEVEAFLASGGKINSIDVDVLADPPKKPQSSYGSQPI
ncbi:hypothetical protein [Agaribacterium sp. ZY112]|uniref:hypothetical protein n=1 Tax=Agaribacterium sp. ZY112 TaxID=3233574 RepID=UPI0035248A05